VRWALESSGSKAQRTTPPPIVGFDLLTKVNASSHVPLPGDVVGDVVGVVGGFELSPKPMRVTFFPFPTVIVISEIVLSKIESYPRTRTRSSSIISLVDMSERVG
jgi:hypothetical protein